MGAGIGGLAAAHRLKLLSEQRALPLEIVVLEATERAGGLVGTERHEGALLERGPDTLVTHKPAGVALCRELGLGDRLFYPKAGRTDILIDDRLLPVPAGFALLAPTRRAPLVRSPLLSWRGKLRALAEPMVSRSPSTHESAESGESDESVGAFVRRRFGGELLERIVEPIVGAIYMADVERLSLAATFPRFLALEREHGSLSRALGRRPPIGAPPAAGVVGLVDGLEQLVAALVTSLPPGSLRLAARVERLTRDDEGYRLQLADGAHLAANALVLATPGHAAASLLREIDPALAAEMRKIDYASCATLNLAWPRGALTQPRQSLGFFVPRRAGVPLVAAGFVDVKFPERVPAEFVVVRLFLGGALWPEIAEQRDDELVEIATRALAPLLGTREPPAWVRLFRHSRAMPQLAVGHLDLAARLRDRAAAHLGLELAGGPTGAYGLADSIASGEHAAQRLFEWCAAARPVTAVEALKLP